MLFESWRVLSVCTFSLSFSPFLSLFLSFFLKYLSVSYPPPSLWLFKRILSKQYWRGPLKSSVAKERTPAMLRESSVRWMPLDSSNSSLGDIILECRKDQRSSMPRISNKIVSFTLFRLVMLTMKKKHACAHAHTVTKNSHTFSFFSSPHTDRHTHIWHGTSNANDSWSLWDGGDTSILILQNNKFNNTDGESVRGTQEHTNSWEAEINTVRGTQWMYTHKFFVVFKYKIAHTHTTTTIPPHTHTHV